MISKFKQYLLQQNLAENTIDSYVYSVKSYLSQYDEITKNFAYEVKHAGSAGYKYMQSSEDTPNWMYNSNYMYWTMSSFDDSSLFLWSVLGNGNLGYFSVNDDDISVVRPVINLKKSVIEKV